MKNNWMIRTDKLSVKLGKNTILDNINLNVPYHSIYGFLGPNGAGKTTLIRSLLGLVRFNNGEVKIMDKNPDQQRMILMRQVGSMIEKPLLYPHLTGKENLQIYQKAYGLKKASVEHVLEIVKLSHAASQKTGTYSLGMKQRAAIAIALIHDPELLILDEPANGLDPGGIKEIRELIVSLNKDYGKTIFISSHLLSEIEKISTHIGVIHQGKLIFQGKLSALETLKKQVIRIETNKPSALADKLKEELQPASHINHKYIDLPIANREDIPVLMKKIIRLGFPVYQAQNITNSDLENSFFNLINQSKNDKKI